MIIGITFTGHAHISGEARMRQRNKEEVNTGRKIQQKRRNNGRGKKEGKDRRKEGKDERRKLNMEGRKEKWK